MGNHAHALNLRQMEEICRRQALIVTVRFDNSTNNYDRTSLIPPTRPPPPHPEHFISPDIRLTNDLVVFMLKSADGGFCSLDVTNLLTALSQRPCDGCWLLATDDKATRPRAKPQSFSLAALDSYITGERASLGIKQPNETEVFRFESTIIKQITTAISMVTAKKDQFAI